MNRRIVDDLCAHQPQVKLLYVTPERLETQAFFEVARGLHARGRLALLAVDEAHCISTWGACAEERGGDGSIGWLGFACDLCPTQPHPYTRNTPSTGSDFRPKYRTLGRLRDAFPDVPTLALTATATAKVQQDIREQLRVRRRFRESVGSVDTTMVAQPLSTTTHHNPDPPRPRLHLPQELRPPQHPLLRAVQAHARQRLRHPQAHPRQAPGPGALPGPAGDQAPAARAPRQGGDGRGKHHVDALLPEALARRRGRGGCCWGRGGERWQEGRRRRAGERFSLLLEES